VLFDGVLVGFEQFSKSGRAEVAGPGEVEYDRVGGLGERPAELTAPRTGALCWSE
jgi:hypothetical protein